MPLTKLSGTQLWQGHQGLMLPEWIPPWGWGWFPARLLPHPGHDPALTSELASCLHVLLPTQGRPCSLTPQETCVCRHLLSLAHSHQPDPIRALACFCPSLQPPRECAPPLPRPFLGHQGEEALSVVAAGVLEELTGTWLERGLRTVFPRLFGTGD